jgi:hypothetical protein
VTAIKPQPPNVIRLAFSGYMADTRPTSLGVVQSAVNFNIDLFVLLAMKLMARRDAHITTPVPISCMPYR